MAFAAYLLDIEGTTTPIDFVTRTLFPYARERLGGFVEAHLDDEVLVGDATLLAVDYVRLRAEGPPDWPLRPAPTGMVPFLEWLMDRDAKLAGLKSIQGRIWEDGYRSGDLLGEVYPDVEPAMRRWKAAGANVHIFSSGSVLAQRLLFGHLPQGDLTPLITSYFDTTTGPKREARSYATIARKVGVEPAYVLFLSDVQAEVDAASQAGLQATLVMREGGASGFPDSIISFDEIGG